MDRTEFNADIIKALKLIIENIENGRYIPYSLAYNVVIDSYVDVDGIPIQLLTKGRNVVLQFTDEGEK